MNRAIEIHEGLGEYRSKTDFLQCKVLDIADKQGFINEADLESIGDYIGRGGCSLVFKLDRVNAVVKLGMTTLMDVGGINFNYQHINATQSVNALQKGKGLEHLEQLRAFRLEGIPAIVTGHVTGQSLGQLSPYVLPAATEPYLGLTRTWRTMGANGLVPDQSADNIMWSGSDFTVIDYFLATNPAAEPHELENNALNFAWMLLPEDSKILPLAAVAFRDVCRSEFGKRVVADMENIWEAHDYRVPLSR